MTKFDDKMFSEELRHLTVQVSTVQQGESKNGFYAAAYIL
jgi:hypothetical protein